MTQTDQIAIATEAWGTPLPDWIEVLARHCQRTSQNAVARRLDRSSAVVSQVLRRRYEADTARIEERVRGVLMNGTLLCPSLGDLPTQECQDWRDKSREFVSGNPLRTRMFRACRGCALNTKEAET